MRLHQKVLFLSCFIGASSKTLDKRYLNRRTPEEIWSTLHFPNENPSNKDLVLLGAGNMAACSSWGNHGSIGALQARELHSLDVAP